MAQSATADFLKSNNKQKKCLGVELGKMPSSAVVAVSAVDLLKTNRPITQLNIWAWTTHPCVARIIEEVLV